MSLALAAFLLRFVKRLRAKPTTWTIDQLRARLNSAAQPLLLDVRPAADFNGELGHIAGAYSVPLEELETRLAEVTEDRTGALAVICRTDRRATQAAQLLARRGYTNVHVVSGGMVEWNSSGLPVERYQETPV